MAAQSRGSVNVLVHPPNDSLEAMATLFFSSRSVSGHGQSGRSCPGTWCTGRERDTSSGSVTFADHGVGGAPPYTTSSMT